MNKITSTNTIKMIQTYLENKTVTPGAEWKKISALTGDGATESGGEIRHIFGRDERIIEMEEEAVGSLLASDDSIYSLGKKGGNATLIVEFPSLTLKFDVDWNDEISDAEEIANVVFSALDKVFDLGEVEEITVFLKNDCKINSRVVSESMSGSVYPSRTLTQATAKVSVTTKANLSK